MKTRVELIFVLLCAVLVACNSLTFKTFVSKDEGFNVLLPCDPKKKEESDQAAGTLFFQTGYLCNTDYGVYGLIYWDLPDVLMNNADDEKILKMWSDDEIATLGGSINSENRIEIDGFLGREVIATTRLAEKQADIRVRYYLVNSRMYEVKAIGESGKMNKSDIDRFLNSFKLLK